MSIFVYMRCRSINLEPSIIVIGIVSTSLHLVLKSYQLILPVRYSTSLTFILNSSVTCGISTLPEAVVNIMGRSSFLNSISLANCGLIMLIYDPVSYSTFKSWSPSLVGYLFWLRHKFFVLRPILQQECCLWNWIVAACIGVLIVILFLARSRTNIFTTIVVIIIFPIFV